MKFLITGRQGGKTELTMRWMHEHPEAICVVHSSMEADRLHRDYKIDRRRLFLPGSVMFGHTPNAPVAVDNLDLILRQLLKTNNPIELVTATGESIWPVFGADFSQET